MPFGFVVDTEACEGDDIRDDAFAPDLHDVFPGLMPDGFPVLMWGLEEKYRDRPLPKRKPRLELPWFFDNIYLTPEPAFGSTTLDMSEFRLWSDPRSLPGFLEVFMPMLSAAWTELKFMIVSLSVLNDVPVVASDIPAKPGRAVGGRHSGAGLGHSVISLRIPARQPAKWLRRRLDGSVIRKRRHEVRGHWRTYLDRESGEVRRKVWIAEHHRGDPALGEVIHQYRASAAYAPETHEPESRNPDGH